MMKLHMQDLSRRQFLHRTAGAALRTAPFVQTARARDEAPTYC